MGEIRPSYGRLLGKNALIIRTGFVVGWAIIPFFGKFSPFIIRIDEAFHRII